jgi:hypothetical protein
MNDKFILALALSAFTTMPVLAQGFDYGGGATNIGNAPGTTGNGTYRTRVQSISVPAPGSGAVDAGSGMTFDTQTQGANSPGGPQLTGDAPTPGGGSGQNSGAATSAPIRGTYQAPGNLALKKQGLQSLPPTRLDSFVKESGKSEAIYGDEGCPFYGFSEEHRIEKGIKSDGLTTGQKSDAPSAWDYPQ